MIHLPTGRVCLLPERHAGGCQFSYLVPEVDRELWRSFGTSLATAEHVTPVLGVTRVMTTH